LDDPEPSMIAAIMRNRDLEDHYNGEGCR